MHFLIILLFTTADSISSLTAFAALITGITTFFTVKEIKKQREHSYHPDINIADFDFYVYQYDESKHEEDEGDDIFSLYYSKKRLTETEPKEGYNELTIGISNIGFGVAKQLSWHWETDFIELYHSIKGDDDDFIKWAIMDGDLEVSVKKLDIEWIYLIGEENEGGFFNFILPYSIENRENKIRIPSYFIDLFWLYKTKAFVEGYRESEKEYPPLQLNMEYTDIDGKKLEKIFFLYLRYRMIASPYRKESELGWFKFEIVEAI